MRAVAQFCDVVDLINDAIGRWAAWLLIPVSYTHLTLPTIYSV